MDSLFQKISQIEDQSLPFDISKKVQEKILVRKLRFPILLGSLLLANLAFVCYWIYVCLIETSAVEVIRAIVSDFEMSWSYVSDSAEGLFETMPMSEIRILIVNLGLIAILGFYIYRTYKSQKKIFINY